MAIAESSTADASAYLHRENYPAAAAFVPDEGTGTAVAWGAILAGAAVAASASLILLSLGAGLGLSAISPWAHQGVKASTFGVASIAWVIVTQLCASALGGYLAGRLRTRWLATHPDEVHFRDTAHGLLAWAVASLATAASIAAAASGAVGASVQAAATVASGTSTSQPQAGSMPPLDYVADTLFRRDGSTVAPATSASDTPGASAPEPKPIPLAEVTRILRYAVQTDRDALPPSDAQYLAQLVSQRTGIAPEDAQKRVNGAYGAMRDAANTAKAEAAVVAEKARKAGIQAALWVFIGLLAGAFIASYTALLGGRERDA